MAQTSWPFENADTTETQYSALFAKLQTTGVDGDQSGTTLAVSATTGLVLSVATGFAIIRGFAYQSTAAEALTLDSGDTQPRIDLAVLRLDPSANSIVLAVKKGTPAASPSAPALTQTASGIWEMPLAQIAVAANATAVGAGNITDVRRFLSTQVGTWTTATRPASPTLGVMGYNSSLAAYEFWNGSAWGTTVTIADGSITDAKFAVPPRRYLDVRYVAGHFTLAPTDAGKLIQVVTGTTGATVTVNADSLTGLGDRVDFLQETTGAITFAAGSGVIIYSKDSKLKTNGQFTGATLIRTNSGQYRLIGDLTA